jgi:Zn-dependent protease
MPENASYLLIFIPIILFAITIHEFAHAWTADYFGDSTARLMGRITLNPIAHLDPIGVLCFVFAGFGWGKPVPVNVYNLRHPTRDNMLISAAGPLSNLVAAALFGLVVRLVGLPHDPGIHLILWRFAYMGVKMNVILAVFNLIPLHPLDGSHVLAGLLPRSAAAAYESFGAYGPTILLLLLLASSFGGIPVFGVILGPPVDFLTALFTGRSTGLF